MTFKHYFGKAAVQHESGEFAIWAQGDPQTALIGAGVRHFDADGVINETPGHNYDFLGKSRFITKLAKELECHPIDIR